MRNTIRQPILILAVCAPLLLSGCASNPSQQKIGAAVGGILGGIGGALIAHPQGRTAAIIIGILMGVTIGGGIGRTMDEVDRMRVAQILERTPSRRPMSWRNPNSGIQYTVTPRRTYQRPAPRYRMKVAQMLEHTPSRRSMSWRNPDSGRQYTVTPWWIYQRSAARRYCREYILKAQVGGRYQQIYSTACRQPDGSWQVRS